MDILFTLIPLSIVLVFAVLAVLAWATHAGQFEDLDAEGQRILEDDDSVHADGTHADAPPGQARSDAPRTGASAPRDAATGSGRDDVRDDDRDDVRARR